MKSQRTSSTVGSWASLLHWSKSPSNVSVNFCLPDRHTIKTLDPTTKSGTCWPVPLPPGLPPLMAQRGALLMPLYNRQASKSYLVSLCCFTENTFGNIRFCLQEGTECLWIKMCLGLISRNDKRLWGNLRLTKPGQLGAIQHFWHQNLLIFVVTMSISF